MTTRSCPACEAGEVETESLADGSVCKVCGRTIEIDLFYSAGIPSVLAILTTVFFTQQNGVGGFVSLGLLFGFTFGYRSFCVKWLPIKHYEDT